MFLRRRWNCIVYPDLTTLTFEWSVTGGHVSWDDMLGGLSASSTPTPSLCSWPADTTIDYTRLCAPYSCVFIS